MTYFQLYLEILQGIALGFAVAATIVTPCYAVSWAWTAYLHFRYDRQVAAMEARRKASPANVTVLYTTPSARVRVSK